MASFEEARAVIWTARSARAHLVLVLLVLCTTTVQIACHESREDQVVSNARKFLSPADAQRLREDLDAARDAPSYSTDLEHLLELSRQLAQFGSALRAAAEHIQRDFERRSGALAAEGRRRFCGTKMGLGEGISLGAAAQVAGGGGVHVGAGLGLERIHDLYHAQMGIVPVRACGTDFVFGVAGGSASVDLSGFVEWIFNFESSVNNVVGMSTGCGIGGEADIKEVAGLGVSAGAAIWSDAVPRECPANWLDATARACSDELQSIVNRTCVSIDRDKMWGVAVSAGGGFGAGGELGAALSTGHSAVCTGTPLFCATFGNPPASGHLAKYERGWSMAQSLVRDPVARNLPVPLDAALIAIHTSAASMALLYASYCEPEAAEMCLPGATCSTTANSCGQIVGGVACTADTGGKCISGSCDRSGRCSSGSSRYRAAPNVICRTVLTSPDLIQTPVMDDVYFVALISEGLFANRLEYFNLRTNERGVITPHDIKINSARGSTTTVELQSIGRISRISKGKIIVGGTIGSGRTLVNLLFDLSRNLPVSPLVPDGMLSNDRIFVPRDSDHGFHGVIYDLNATPIEVLPLPLTAGPVQFFDSRIIIDKYDPLNREYPYSVDLYVLGSNRWASLPSLHIVDRSDILNEDNIAFISDLTYASPEVIPRVTFSVYDMRAGTTKTLDVAPIHTIARQFGEVAYDYSGDAIAMINYNATSARAEGVSILDTGSSTVRQIVEIGSDDDITVVRVRGKAVLFSYLVKDATSVDYVVCNF